MLQASVTKHSCSCLIALILKPDCPDSQAAWSVGWALYRVYTLLCFVIFVIEMRKTFFLLIRSEISVFILKLLKAALLNLLNTRMLPKCFPTLSGWKRSLKQRQASTGMQKLSNWCHYWTVMKLFWDIHPVVLLHRYHTIPQCKNISWQVNILHAKSDFSLWTLWVLYSFMHYFTYYYWWINM